MRRAQFLRHKLARTPLGQLPHRLLNVRARPRERLEVACARRHRAAIECVVAHARLQMRAQRVDALTGGRGERDARRPGASVGDRNADGKIAFIEYQRHRNVARQPLALLSIGIAGGIFYGIDDEQHAIRAQHFRFGPADALFFRKIERRAQARGVEHVQRHAVDVDALAQDIARRAGQRRYDGGVVAGEAIQQT